MRTLLIIVLSFVVVSSASAEPNSAVRYLMDEPATMLDIGIHKMETFLEAYAAGTHDSISVGYVSDSGKISISLSQAGPIRFKTKKEARDWCDSTMSTIKTLCGCFPGKPCTSVNPSGLWLFFSHEDHRNIDNLMSLRGKIDQIVDITVSTTWGNPGGKKGHLHCYAPLLGTELLFFE